MNIKKNIVVVLVVFLGLLSCETKEVVNEKESSTSNALEVASAQYHQLAETILSHKDSSNFLPRSVRDGDIRYVGMYDWTSGFYPGSLWYLYELTGEESWKKQALEYTLKLDSVQYYTRNHDLGFMMECSYGNAIRLTNNKEYDKVIVQSAKSLITRYREKPGIIQSWDPVIHFEEGMWETPVIIDNMMNLELLFHASKITGDSIYQNIAITHANNTLKNHFRADNSSYHVVDYNVENGEVIKKTTHQGSADESAWSRGQAWGLYGFTDIYKETKDERYLEQAIKIAEFIKNHPKLPSDQVPYWDYDVEITDSTPRDASAAAITASGLLELINHVDEKKAAEYLAWAKQIIASLSTAPYLAEAGTNFGYILKHSSGVIPYNSEVDVPLNYADYYYLEALVRLKELK